MASSNPPHKRTLSAHEWTTFEKTTLLALLAKGTHLTTSYTHKKDSPDAYATQNAYLNVATALNKALNGDGRYGEDIDKREVTRMIDRLMVEKKAVLGPGGYMERGGARRLTRGLKMMFERSSKFDFDGSVAEWTLWRRDREEEKARIAAGLPPKEVDADTLSHGHISNLPQVVTVEGEEEKEEEQNIWQEADTAARVSPKHWRFNSGPPQSLDTSLTSTSNSTSHPHTQTQTESQALPNTSQVESNSRSPAYIVPSYSSFQILPVRGDGTQSQGQGQGQSQSQGQSEIQNRGLDGRVGKVVDMGLRSTINASFRVNKKISGGGSGSGSGSREGGKAEGGKQKFPVKKGSRLAGLAKVDDTTASTTTTTSSAAAAATDGDK